jgi:hypothetical protein
MDLNNKLKGIPKIYYFNLDERTDRREYTESQYDLYQIKNYVRYSTSEYQHHNFEEWKDKLILNDINISNRPNLHIIECAMTLMYLEFFKSWLETTDEDHLLIMEDDYDLSYINYWHFDWEYLMNNIPFDWDCIQLSFENNTTIPCFLSPNLPDHSMGAALLNRRYIEKIVRVLTVDGKFDLRKRISNYRRTQKVSHPYLKNNQWRHPNMSADYIIGHCGRTYCLPLITQSTTIGSYLHNVARKEDYPSLHFTERAVKLWWTKFRDKFSLEDFFMYGKPNDFYITIKNIDDFESNFKRIEESLKIIDTTKQRLNKLSLNKE